MTFTYTPEEFISSVDDIKKFNKGDLYRVDIIRDQNLPNAPTIEMLFNFNTNTITATDKLVPALADNAEAAYMGILAIVMWGKDEVESSTYNSDNRNWGLAQQLIYNTAANFEGDITFTQDDLLLDTTTTKTLKRPQ